MDLFRVFGVFRGSNHKRYAMMKLMKGQNIKRFPNSRLFIFSWIFLTLGLFCQTAFGCECDYPSACYAYSNSKDVFIGTLKKLEIDKTIVPQKLHIYYEVKRVLKGDPQGIVKVTFDYGDCASNFGRDDVRNIGKEFLVFRDGGDIQYICNRTSLLSDVKSDLEYFDKILASKPSFTIGATIKNLSPKELSDSSITIFAGKEEHKITLDSKGSFEFVAERNVPYVVKMMFPVVSVLNVRDDMSFLTPLVRTTQKDGKTMAEYDLKFQPYSCDRRTIILGEF